MTSSVQVLKYKVPFMNGPNVVRLQQRLIALSYAANARADGVFGPNTAKAVKAFQSDSGLDSDGVVGEKTWNALFGSPGSGLPPTATPASAPAPSRTDVLQAMRTLADVQGSGYNFSTENGTIEAIKQECQFQGFTLDTQVAYILATIWHETAHTFKPIKERGSLEYLQGKRYYPYYGRGYIQITWKNNYLKYADILGIDLVKTPNLALHPPVALFIAIDGLRRGQFGSKLVSFINNSRCDFVGARQAVNGTDRNKDIAKIAEGYLQKLRSGTV